MPTPKPNESESNFVARCVVDAEAVRDFPDTQQRIAFCYSQFERSKKNEVLNKQNKIDRDKWQSSFERQLDIAEKKQIAIVKRFYKREYNKGIESFIADGQTNFQLLFDNKDLLKIYRDLYTDIGMRFAKWYVNNFQKFITKAVDTSSFDDIWRDTFGAYGSAVGAQRVTLVSGTAKKTLIDITQRLMRDPEFMTLGAVERGRILRNQFNRYSQFQSERLVRTEATAAANFATTQAAQTIFPPEQMQKEWIASFDDRTRDTHSEADGQIVMANNTFLVGGQQMMFPGDPAGGAAEVINCRCSVAYIPIEGAQTIGQIENINFGLGGGTQTGFGLDDFASAIGSATTIKQLEEFSNNYFKQFNQKNKFKTNLNGIDFKVANEIINHLVELTKQYKIKNFYQIYVDDLGSVAAKVSRIPPSNDTILIIDKNSFKNINRLNSRTLSGQENSYFAIVDKINLSKATITHEFAHLFGVNSRKVVQSNQWRSFNKKLLKLFKEYKSLDIRLSTNKNFISRYALTNVDEFMAESFSMYMLNSNPSPYAIKVGKLIDEYFKL